MYFLFDSTRQAAHAAVDDAAQRAVRRHLEVGEHGVARVEDDDDLDGSGVVLLEDALHGLGHERGARVGRDDDRDAGREGGVSGGGRDAATGVVAGGGYVVHSWPSSSADVRLARRMVLEVCRVYG